MPRNPESIRYQSSAKRGYATQSLERAQKVALDAAAARAGYKGRTATQKYIWALAIGDQTPDPGLEALRVEAQKKLDEENKKD